MSIRLLVQNNIAFILFIFHILLRITFSIISTLSKPDITSGCLNRFFLAFCFLVEGVRESIDSIVYCVFIDINQQELGKTINQMVEVVSTVLNLYLVNNKLCPLDRQIPLYIAGEE